jgi:hypothetical protein
VASKQTFLNTYVSKLGPKIVSNLFHTPLAPLNAWVPKLNEEMSDGINAIQNRRVKILSGTSSYQTYAMRDLYHRQNRLAYWIKRVDTDLKEPDRTDILKLIEDMQDRIIDIMHLFLTKNHNRKHGLWTNKCSRGCICGSYNRPYVAENQRIDTFAYESSDNPRKTRGKWCGQKSVRELC